MRKSTIYILTTLSLGLFLGSLVFLYPLSGEASRQSALRETRGEVRRLLLTDLCLFSEARYTRHLSQSDLHSAFQDHPLALDHFISGSMTVPPASLWAFHVEMD